VHGDETELRQWSYIVVEEIVDGVVVLNRWPWPLADQCGRLFWAEGDEHGAVETVVPLPVLRRQLYEPNNLTRRPRAGDTFATERTGAGWASDTPAENLHALLPAGVYDISADAHEAARLAYEAAVAAVVSSDQDEAVVEALRDLDTERSDRQAPPLEVAAEDVEGEQR
jgi:hypothetical protein